MRWDINITSHSILHFRKYTYQEHMQNELLIPKHRQDRKRFTCNGGQQLEIQPSV